MLESQKLFQNFILNNFAVVKKYTTTGDGSVGCYLPSWSLAHSCTSGHNGGGTGVHAGAVSDGATLWTNGSGSWYITRTFLPFSTTALPSNAIIDSATLHLKGRQYIQGGTISLVSASQSSPATLVDTDFDNITTTKLATDKDTADFSTTATMQSWNLNTTGLATIISSQSTGTFDLAVLTSNDFTNTDPTSYSGNNYGLADISTSKDITPNRPYIDITYHTLISSTAPAQTYFYDNNGNLTNDSTTTYTYDYTNRLTQTTTGTTTTTYTYDTSGQRLSQITGTGSTQNKTYYPYGNYSLNSANNSTTTTVYVGNNLATVEQTQTATTTQPAITKWNHTDYQQSTNLVTNATGNILQTLDYYPYGGSRINTNTTGNTQANKTYIGQFSDTQTSLSYLNARYYDGKRGQFISQDPEFWSISQSWLLDPQNQNSYGYARNNPIRFSDPTGRTIGDIIVGFTNAFSSNMVFGAGRVPSNMYGGNRGDYSTGQTLGDFSGMVAGSIEIVTGGTIAGGGTILTVGSGGATAALSIPVAAGGAALTTYGVGVGGVSAYNFSQSIQKNDAVNLGKYAGDSIDARSEARDFTKTERNKINDIGKETGCHTCGSKNSGTKSGNFVPDHQPASAIVPKGTPQQLYPQCINCSRAQGGQIKNLIQNTKK